LFGPGLRGRVPRAKDHRRGTVAGQAGRLDCRDCRVWHPVRTSSLEPRSALRLVHAARFSWRGHGFVHAFTHQMEAYGKPPNHHVFKSAPGIKALAGDCERPEAQKNN